MPYHVERWERFGGLDLRAVDEVGPMRAIDLLDVEIDHEGTLKSRSGLTTHVTPTASTAITLLRTFDTTLMANPASLLAVSYDGGLAGRVTAWKFDTEALIASFTTTNRPQAMVVYGSPGIGNTLAYFVGGQIDAALHTLLKFDGTTFTAISPANLSPSGGSAIGISPSDNRLVISAEQDRLWFSDAGAPETFSANNFLYVDPSDGDSILGMANWNNLLFVFKKKRFYVFYGNSVDSTGNPVFNYRRVDTGLGSITNPAAAVAPEGVYFWDKDRGLCLTSGGPAQIVSHGLDPLLFGEQSSFYTAGLPQAYLILGPDAMCYFGGRVYMTWNGGTFPGLLGTQAPRTLVYDTATQSWLIWSCGGQAIWPYKYDTGPSSTSFFDASTHILMDNANAATRSVFRLDPTSTNDAAVAGGGVFTGRYRQGFWTPSQDASVSYVREVVLEGSGAGFFVKGSRDWGALDAGTAVTMGGIVSEKRVRTAYKGRNFSFEFSAAGRWSLERAQAHVRGSRAVGVH